MQYKNETNCDVLEEVSLHGSVVFLIFWLNRCKQKLELADQVSSLLRKNVVEAVREEEGSTPSKYRIRARWSLDFNKIPELHIKGKEGNIKFGDVPKHAK